MSETLSFTQLADQLERMVLSTSFMEDGYVRIKDPAYLMQRLRDAAEIERRQQFAESAKSSAEPVAWRDVGYLMSIIDDAIKDGFDPDEDGPLLDEIRAGLTASPSPASTQVGVTEEIAAERRRQIEAEGWTVEHDDEHTEGEMAAAAGVYALAAASHDYRWVLRGSPVNDYLAAAMKLWPWDSAWFKPKDRRRDLIKAGALIVAEIERLDRAAALQHQES